MVGESQGVLLIAVAVLFGVLLVLEILFRLVHQYRHGRAYHVATRTPWAESYITAHPFLTFAYRRGAMVKAKQRLPYPLHPNRFWSFQKPLRLNNVGHFGEDVGEKDRGIMRIACLGASTTANNIADDERDYSYPALLEEYLSNSLSEKPLEKWKAAEVMNCGIGGWVSADIMNNFFLNILPLRPDVVIIYHGFNDLQLHLMEEFQTDYAHARHNVGEFMHAIKRAYRIPQVRFWHSYEWLRDSVFGTGSIRNDLLYLIHDQDPDPEAEFADLSVEQEIFRNIAVVCKHHGIRVILSSMAVYRFRDDPLFRKLADGVVIENENMQALAAELGLEFVDQDNLIPREDEYFVDGVHFAPAGMQAMAKNFQNAILRRGGATT